MQKLESPYRLSYQPVEDSYITRMRRVTARVLRDSYEFENIHLMDRYAQDLYNVFMKRITEIMSVSKPEESYLARTEALFDELLRIKRYLATNQLPPMTQTTDREGSADIED